MQRRCRDTRRCARSTATGHRSCPGDLDVREHAGVVDLDEGRVDHGGGNRHGFARLHPLGAGVRLDRIGTPSTSQRINCRQ